jgi:protein SCO1
MRKALIISLSFSVVLLLTVIYLLGKERTSGNLIVAAVSQSSISKKSCCKEETAGIMSENSIYQLESKWKTESGNQIMLKNLRGRKKIMAMVFANCTYACPLIVNDMKKIESQLNRNDIDFLLISIDPKRDTPEALLQYAKNNTLDTKKWRLLTGDENGVSELAAVVGFKYKKEIDGSFSHSNIINVLNEKGEVVYQHFGLNQDVKDVLETIKKL